MARLEAEGYNVTLEARLAVEAVQSIAIDDMS